MGEYGDCRADVAVCGVRVSFWQSAGGQGFAHVGYPQQLRIILGIAKPLAGIVLLIPGLLRLKEWAYAGLTFAWIAAFIAHHLAKDGAEAFAPLVLLALLALSYLTRPANRRLAPGGPVNF